MNRNVRLYLADFVALKQKPAEATQIITDNASSFVLPESKWVLHYKLGVYAWCSLQWAVGAAEFEKAMHISNAKDRKAMVPYMAVFAMLGYLQSHKQHPGDPSLESKAKQIADFLRKYKKSMHKRHWGKQDAYALRLFKHHEKDEESKVWVLSEIVEIMSLHLRNTWCMDHDQLDKLETMLNSEYQERTTAYTLTGKDDHRSFDLFNLSGAADDKADYYLCLAEIKQRKAHLGKGLDMAAQGVDLEDELSREGKRKGAVPMMLYMMAQMYGEKGDLDRAKACMKELKAHGTHYHLHALVYLKAIVLSQKIGDEFIQDYKQFRIPARMEETVILNVCKYAQVYSVMLY